MSGDAGWNAVIHHPSDLELQNWNWEENDGEQEKELPSTVDMDAIKGGGSWDPATEPNGIYQIYILSRINFITSIVLGLNCFFNCRNRFGRFRRRL